MGYNPPSVPQLRRQFSLNLWMIDYIHMNMCNYLSMPKYQIRYVGKGTPVS